jgi:hypothetical protein
VCVSVAEAMKLASPQIGCAGSVASTSSTSSTEILPLYSRGRACRTRRGAAGRRGFRTGCSDQRSDGTYMGA